MKTFILSFCSACLAFIACNPKTPQMNYLSDNKDIYMLVGTYTGGSSTGIYVYNLNQETGNLNFIGVSPVISNPSYLAISTDERFVYSVCENDRDEAVAASFSFNKEDGTMQLLNTQSVEGVHPCYIAVNKENNFITTANYAGDNSGGTVSVLPIKENGELDAPSQILGFNEDNLPSSHIHTTLFSPTEKYIFVTDLGKDKIYRYTIKTGSENKLFLQEQTLVADLEPGSGPRHLAFHPNGNFLYCISELSGKVTAFEYNEGNLNLLQSIASDTTSGIGGKGSADIHITPDGKFLYASNRLKADGIAIFKINADGTLTTVGYQLTGIHPRNFNITPNGKFVVVAARDSNNVCVFTIDPKTGLLHDTGKEIKVDKPVCIKFISK